MAKAAAPDEASQPKPKKSKKLLIIIIAAVLVLGGGGAGAFMLMGGGAAGAGEGETKKKEEGGGHSAPAAGGHGAPAPGAAGEAAGPPPELFTFERPFMVTLSDAKQQRTIQFTMTLEFADVELATEIQANKFKYEARFRDAIITETTSRTRADVSTPEGMERLRRDIVRKLNAVLGKDKAVDNALFTDYVLP